MINKEKILYPFLRIKKILVYKIENEMILKMELLKYINSVNMIEFSKLLILTILYHDEISQF